MQKQLQTLSLLVAAFTSVASAQSIYGTLVGTVTDESGASLRATVTATQAQTNVSRNIQTSETGNYNLPNLLPGTYQLTVTLAGFQTFNARDVNVEANAEVRIDARLKVGEVRDSVTVSADAAVLQT